jgi:hypothetical protein
MFAPTSTYVSPGDRVLAIKRDIRLSHLLRRMTKKELCEVVENNGFSVEGTDVSVPGKIAFYLRRRDDFVY